MHIVLTNDEIKEAIAQFAEKKLCVTGLVVTKIEADPETHFNGFRAILEQKSDDTCGWR